MRLLGSLDEPEHVYAICRAESGRGLREESYLSCTSRRVALDQQSIRGVLRRIDCFLSPEGDLCSPSFNHLSGLKPLLGFSSLSWKRCGTSKLVSASVRLGRPPLIFMTTPKGMGKSLARYCGRVQKEAYCCGSHSINDVTCTWLPPM